MKKKGLSKKEASFYKKRGNLMRKFSLYKSWKTRRPNLMLAIFIILILGIIYKSAPRIYDYVSKYPSVSMFLLAIVFLFLAGVIGRYSSNRKKLKGNPLYEILLWIVIYIALVLILIPFSLNRFNEPVFYVPMIILTMLFAVPIWVNIRRKYDERKGG